MEIPTSTKIVLVVCACVFGTMALAIIASNAGITQIQSENISNQEYDQACTEAQIMLIAGLEEYLLIDNVIDEAIQNSQFGPELDNLTQELNKFQLDLMSLESNLNSTCPGYSEGIPTVFDVATAAILE